jgi:serine/threonine protein kinase
MPAAATIEQFLETLRRSGLVDDRTLDAYLEAQRAAGTLPEAPQDLASALVRDGLLTRFQAGQVLQGKARGFILNGKYKLLEHLGAGGMGTVYLCEHTSMRRRVAIKVLPAVKARDPSYLERFYREARAVAALDHPNIVRAHDIDRDDKLHFLVMEYIDGTSLQDIIHKHGPMDITRAAHYIAQAALGLQHAHEAGLVHRDIKPGNILVDRGGTVKVLDMGLARFFNDEADNLSKKYDETVLGTSDYLAPEQTLGSDVDIRADIYSLGATFYYILTGQTLFGEGTAAQKLIWHTTRQPRPIQSARSDVPEEMAEVVERHMLAKDPAQRYQTPIEVVEALEPWTTTPIPPPPEDEMPKLSRAAAGPAGEATSGPVTPGTPGSVVSGGRRSWTVSGTTSPKPGRAPITTRRTGITPSPSLPGPATKVAGRNGPATTLTGSGSSKTAGPRSPGSGVKGPRSGAKSGPRADEDEQPGPPSSSKRRRKKGKRNGDRGQALNLDPRLVMIIASAVLVPVTLLVAGLLIWWVAGRTSTPAVHIDTAITAPQAVRPAAPPPEVTISDERGGVHKVKAKTYEAFVENNGCVSSLRVGGSEFLHFEMSSSVRGCYPAWPGGTFLNNLKEQPHQGTTLQASNGQGQVTVRYDFAGDSFTCILMNHSKSPVELIVALDPDIKVVSNEAGEYVRATGTGAHNWPVAVFFNSAGKSRLKIGPPEGCSGRVDTVEGRFAAYRARVEPMKVGRFRLEPGDALPAESASVHKVLQ